MKLKKEPSFLGVSINRKSKKIDQQSAIIRYNYLKKFFDDKVGLVHGSIDKEEKDKILTDFLNKKIDILVSTTVIEVGIDFPNATCIVIENAINLVYPSSSIKR